MCCFYFYPYNSIVLFLYVREMTVKSLKFTMLVKSVVIIYAVNLQYIFIIKMVNVNCRCHS